jgi:uncharacterized protein YecT (DUF1311 family)
MRVILGLTAAALVALTLAGGSPGARIPQPSLACLKTGQSSAQMSRCVEAGYDKARQELATVYAKVLARQRLVPGGSKLLADAEAKWASFRNADCSFAESLNKGGTLVAVDKGICLIRDTIDRANALQDYLTSS